MSSALNIGVRVAAMIVVAALLGACATYHRPYYPDSGVYFGSAGGYGAGSGYRRAGYLRLGYGPVNPAIYPYWSIDYFYFSRYYHPYSVYVGYHEPLYYPYPGWVFGYYRGHHSRHSPAFGFPWHGHRYPNFSFGFFASHSIFHRGGFHNRDRHREHPIRRIDRRLESLRRGDADRSRRALMVRDAGAGGTAWGRPVESRNRLDAQSRHAQFRVRSRSALLQDRRSRSRISRNLPSQIDNSRLGRVRSATSPDRRIERRARERDPIRRDSRRDNDHRSAYRRQRGAERGVPVENLRGRVIVNARDGRARDTLRRESAPSHHSGADRAGSARTISRSIRSAPEAGRGRGNRGSSAGGRSENSRRSVLKRSGRDKRASAGSHGSEGNGRR